MAPRIGFGLRAQIVLALSVVFVVSFALLGMAAVRLTGAAAEVAQLRAARSSARLLASALERSRVVEPRAQSDLLQALRGSLGLQAVLLLRADGLRLAHGTALGRDPIRIALADGSELRVWADPERREPELPLGNLLLLYVSMTGLAVLVLAYFTLTYWIVRPLDRLTRGSEQLAAGSAEVRVPERGAAEVVRLASAFNQMADQLRAERRALVERLAELERKTTELKATQQQLIHGEKLASVGRLAAGVAHEIGNPLSAILGLVELLREGGLLPDAQAEFLERIQGETERIHRIIRDLLDFSRRDVEDESIGHSCDVAQVIDDALKLLHPQKQSRQVAIAIAVEPGLPRVVGPHHRLRQVIVNLLLNALDAIEGQGTIEIDARPGERGGCVLTVSDDGPGLPQSVLDHLFEPFTTTKPPGQGTGLGLAVSHALIEGMGGQISAESLPERGARFRIQLRSADVPARADSERLPSRLAPARNSSD